MSNIAYFHYTLPVFVEPNDYDAERYLADVQKYPYDDTAVGKEWNQLKKFHPWLDQVRPKSAVGHIYSVMSCKLDGATFRDASSTWHTDQESMGEFIALHRTSTPTSFAAARLAIDMTEYETRGFQGNPANPLNGLTRAFGNDWLTDAVGGGNSDLNRVITRVDGLRIEKPSEGFIAIGRTATTLHRASLWQEGEPLQSVITRALYDLPR